MDVKNYKCPCCGAPLRFGSDTQALTCRACGNEFTVEQMDQIADVESSTSAADQMNWERPSVETFSSENLQTMNCPSCGAEVIGELSMIATECPYCGNPTVIDARVEGAMKPDYVIPFKVSREDAKKALESFYKKKPLLPRAFASNNRIEKIAGMYVPFWLFDCDADVDMSFRGTRTQVWSDREYNYTKTDHFMIHRGGNISFEKIPVNGSTRLAENYMEAIEPYDYSDLKPFTTGYLAGYMADRYDVDANDCIPRADERAKMSSEQAFQDTVRGYVTVLPQSSSIHMRSGRVHYVLLPVWMLNTKYNGKMYTFAMNGQTGKMVGELPADSGREALMFGGIFAAVFIVLTLISFLL